MKLLKDWGKGFLLGLGLGALFLGWVYKVAQQSPGDPELNRYYAHLRALDRTSELGKANNQK